MAANAQPTPEPPRIWVNKKIRQLGPAQFLVDFSVNCARKRRIVPSLEQAQEIQDGLKSGVIPDRRRKRLTREESAQLADPQPAPIMMGRQLAELRKHINLTQSVAAPLIGMTKTALAQLEWANRPVPPEVAEAALALEKDPAVLDLPGRCDQSARRRIDDALIVEPALTGKPRTTIASELGVARRSVRARLWHLGLPQGSEGRQYSAYSFIHGEPLIGKHLDDLCRDFGVTHSAAYYAVFAEDLVRVAPVQSLPWNKNAVDVPIAKAKGPRADYQLMHHKFAHFEAHDPLPLRLGHLVKDLRRIWTARFCVFPPPQYTRSFGQVGATCEHAGREFLESEVRDLPTQRQQLYHGLTSLREWLRSKAHSWPSDREILNWICGKVSGEVKRNNGSDWTFRAMMFRWPSLKPFIRRHWDSMIAPGDIGHLIDKLLAEEYRAGERRIRSAARRQVDALQPKALGMRVMAHYAESKRLRLLEAIKDWQPNDQTVARMLIDDPSLTNDQIGLRLDDRRTKCPFGAGFSWQRELKRAAGSKWIRQRVRDRLCKFGLDV